MATITEVKVWPLKKDHPKIKANGSMVIDDVWRMRFTVVNGPTGLFVGFPGKYGEKVDSETGKKPWYSDVYCLDDGVRKEINTEILAAYNKEIGNTDQGAPPDPVDKDQIPF